MSDRKRFYKRVCELADEIDNIGELKYVICELVGRWFLNGKKYSRAFRIAPINAVLDVAFELRKRLIDPYDFPVHPSEDLKSFSEIDDNMKWILGGERKR